MNFQFKDRLRIPALQLGWFLLAWALCALARGQATRYESARFVVEAPEPGLSNLDFHARICEDALTMLSPDYPKSLDSGRKLRVRVSPGRRDFERNSRMSAHSALAVAFPEKGIIVLNDEALRQAGAMQRLRTVAHEMVHLLLGRAGGVRGPVPYYLHEGLAQVMSGEDLGAGTVRLAWATVTGRLHSMVSLIRRFPYGRPDAPLAYAQSESFTRYVAREGLAFSSAQDLFRFILAKPSQAATILSRLSSPEIVAELEVGWRRKIATPMNWFLILTTGGIGWGLLAVLVIVAYWRKKRREPRVMDDWDAWERESDPDQL